MKLGEILMELGYVDARQLERALARQSDVARDARLGEVLLEDGSISERQLLFALGQQFNMTVLVELEEQMLDPSLVQDVPLDWARSRKVLPIRYNGGIGLLTSDPSSITEQEDLALILREDPIPILAPEKDILKGIERCYYKKSSETSDFIGDLHDKEKNEVEDAPDNDLLRSSDHAPVARLVNLILLEAVKAGASDIHLEPYENQLRLRYRIDGLLYDQTVPPKHLKAELVSRLKVMGGLDIAEKRLPQDGSVRLRVGEKEWDVRISTMPVVEGERVVLRLLARESTLLSLDQLGMSADMLSHFRELLKEPNGVIWVTGPTGSGKTTTLYASLQEIDTANLNVMTIEDPVEYQLSQVSQMTVKPKIGLTFARGLRHILRQDPDIILVGETRDEETAQIVIQASLTGHLVFSTLHTNDAVGAVIRLMDMGTEPYLVSSATRASIAQRLVRKLCAHCREPASISAEECHRLGRFADRLKNEQVWKAKGCSHCLGGYKGRTALFECMVITPELSDAIRDGVSPSTLKKLARTSGMKTMLEDGIGKVLEGKTSVEEIIHVAGRHHGEEEAR